MPSKNEPAAGGAVAGGIGTSASGIAAYCELLENRIVELLGALSDDDERRSMMQQLEGAALEAGVHTAPAPDPTNPAQWAVDLLSGNPSMTSMIQNRLRFEWMPHPASIENLDEIVSAVRPTHSLD